MSAGEGGQGWWPVRTSFPVLKGGILGNEERASLCEGETACSQTPPGSPAEAIPVGPVPQHALQTFRTNVSIEIS